MQSMFHGKLLITFIYFLSTGKYWPDGGARAKLKGSDVAFISKSDNLQSPLKAQSVNFFTSKV